MKEQLNAIFNKYMDRIKPLMVPVLVLYIIQKEGKASTVELKAGLEEIAGREIQYEYTSFYRLIGQLRYEYELIEEVDLVKEKGPPRIYYGLTPLGKAVLEKIYGQVIVPLQKIILIKEGN